VWNISWLQACLGQRIPQLMENVHHIHYRSF
jgi:hypothetical protein